MIYGDTTKSIKEIISSADKGMLFTLNDFYEAGKYDAVRKVISRLVRENKIIRVKSGVYQKPNYSTFLKENITVSPDDAANIIAKKNNWTIVPANDAALNLIGLTTQIPAKYIYASDGPNRKVQLDNGFVLEFRSRTNREIAGLSFKSRLVIEALKTLGKNNINEKIKNELRKQLNALEIKKLKKESLGSRNWIREIITAL